MNNKSKEINEQIEFGLESIDTEEIVEIKLKDLMFVYNTFSEFNRFFHNPDHYPTIEDVNTYFGNRNAGAYSVISKIYYQLLSQYIPKDIYDKFGEIDDPFDNPKSPYYFKVKNDENIDDGTLKVIDKESFTTYAKNLLEDFKLNGGNWENKSLENFIEAIYRYASDIDGYYSNMNFDTSPNTPTWRIFAQILKGASVYE